MLDKVSFLKLPVAIDTASLVRDYRRIADDAWRPSHWPTAHGSVEFVLLRGGGTGTELDFYCPDVGDRPVLEGSPYLAELVRPEGPFGGAQFAFLFRMRPSGVARLHRDAVPIWRSLHRVHVPIATNPGARLVTGDRRAQHFALGEAWTFDNEALHGALNGASRRTHLILDIPSGNAAMQALRTSAARCGGEPVSDADWARLQWPD